MGNQKGQAPGMQVITEGHAHIGLRCSVLIQSHSGREGDIHELPCAIALVKVVWLTIIGYQQIQFAVVVEVRPDCGKPVPALWIANARLLRNISESSVSVIVVQSVGRSLESTWSALNGNAHVPACVGGPECRQVVEMKINVMRNKKVYTAIAVVVSKCCAGGPERIAA